MSHPIITLAVMAALAGPVGARTLTFDAVPKADGPQPLQHVEQGVTVTADQGSDGVLYDINPGTIHLDDSGTSNTAGVNFTIGANFGARGFSAIGFPLASFVDDGENALAVPYDNVLVQGFLSGAEVGRASFSTGLDGGAMRFSLGASFADIDMLRISAVWPTGQQWMGLSIQCNEAPCGHFELDSVTLAPVPLPAGLPLAAAGLAALAGLRIVRRA